MTDEALRGLMGLAVSATVMLAAGAGRAQFDLEVFVNSGDPAPGTSVGVEFRSIGTPVINAVGDVAFFANLIGPGVRGVDNTGIWGPNAAGALSLNARENDQAPGTPAGVSFFFLFFTPVINAAGEAAFQAGLRGTGVTPANDSGMWRQGAAGSRPALPKTRRLIDVGA